MAIPPAAAVPAIPTKCPLPMLLANREAPIYKEKKQKLALMFMVIFKKSPSFGTLNSCLSMVVVMMRMTDNQLP